jgi:hypothetical protein
MRKLITATILLSNLSIGAFALAEQNDRDHWLPKLTVKDQSLVLGKCFVEVKPLGKQKENWLEILLQTVDEQKQAISGWASFTFDQKTGLPVAGFSICNSSEHGPVEIETTYAGDLKRVKYRCGSTLAEVLGQAEIVLNKKTQQVEHMEIDISGSYENPLKKLTPAVPHLGPLRYKMQKFVCTKPEYKDEYFKIADGINSLTGMQRGTFKVERGILNDHTYKKLEARGASSERRGEMDSSEGPSANHAR